MNGHDLDRARDALHAIPPDLPREDWVKVGMAAHAAGLTFDEFDAWSAGADCYESAAARDTWRSFKPGKGIGAGTLFRMAGDHGERTSKTRQKSGSKAPARPPEAARAPRPGIGAAEVWARCKPAPADHPYIIAKDGRPDGLRVVPDAEPLRIAGASVAGWLVVPVLPLAGGDPVSLQFIPPPGAGKKLNHPGASVAGVFTVGELAQGGTAFLCEGIGQAWACWKASGAAAVGCFGWGRVRGVAAELRQRDASARLVLVPDVGKEADAERIARDVGAAVARMEVPPLVVFDTKSAILAMDEENSNTEASAIVAMLKQDFEGLPVWLVGHVSKPNMNRADAAGLSLRGGSAFEADANQVLYLVKEGESRYLVRGKTRFEAEWPELQIESRTAATMARDEFGDMQAVTLRWAIATPPEQSRKEAQEQAQEAARKADAAALRDEVREVIEVAWLGGFPLNREGVKAKVRRNRNEVTDTIENLLAERWLHEVVIPPKERTNPKRGAFLVNLTTIEHEAAIRGEGLPPAKLLVPESWRRPAAPSVSEPAPQDEAEAAHASDE